jgi:hypothetical protein
MWNNYRRERTDNLEAANAFGNDRSFRFGGADGRQKKVPAIPALCAQRKPPKLSDVESASKKRQYRG